jgi:hypothetical protein
MNTQLTKTIQYDGRPKTMKVNVRFNDECKNGHDTFAITGEIGNNFIAGCIHEEIKKHFPELKKYIKWHLTSTDGPMHYFANTIYWAKQGNLDYARSSAVWENATLEELSDKVVLADRLKSLMNDFHNDMNELKELVK